MKKHRAPVEKETSSAQEVGGDGFRMAGGVFTATLVELQNAGRVSTAAGQSALALATRLDFGATDTGSSLAALSKQHLAALAEALKDVAAVVDPIDELQERRKARSA